MILYVKLAVKKVPLVSVAYRFFYYYLANKNREGSKIRSKYIKENK